MRIAPTYKHVVGSSPNRCGTLNNYNQEKVKRGFYIGAIKIAHRWEVASSSGKVSSVGSLSQKLLQRMKVLAMG